MGTIEYKSEAYIRSKYHLRIKGLVTVAHGGSALGVKDNTLSAHFR